MLKNVINTPLDAVRVQAPGITQCIVNKYISKWFRGVEDRKGGRQKRKKPANTSLADHVVQEEQAEEN